MSICIEQPRYSCALGAQQSVIAIKRAVPVVHAGPGCSVKITRFIGQGEGYAGGSTIPCTNASETEIVYGGEEKLRSVIDGAFKVIDADLYVVMTGCTSDIVGDDIGRITGDYQEQDKPIVYVETGGFKSSNYVSHELVVNAIIDQYVDKFCSDKTVTKGLVNVFSVLPYQDPYWNGNLEEIKRILEGIGLKVNILFGAGSGGVDEWKTIPKAECNIVAGAWAGLGIARHLRDKYGIPYVHFPYLPIGGRETTRFLRQVAGSMALEPGRVDAFIAGEEEKFYMHIERTAEFMLEFRYGLPRKFYTILDASYAVGFAKFLLNELGILPAKQFIVDHTPEEFQNSIREQFTHISELRSAEVSFWEDGGAVQELAREIGADLLIVSPPVFYRLTLNCGYAGYNGGLRAIEDIYDRVLDTYR